LVDDVWAASLLVVAVSVVDVVWTALCVASRVLPREASVVEVTGPLAGLASALDAPPATTTIVAAMNAGCRLWITLISWGVEKVAAGRTARA
jgi:hypothetical protein